MTFFSFVFGLFKALGSIQVIAGYLEAFSRAATLWYVERATQETLSEIADAAALGARAQTQQERYAVASAWQKALSRPRVTL